MRDAPTYAEAIQRGLAGDDPLGLAAGNERLYNSALPGFNNYVRYVRVYSAVCWMIRQAGLALENRAAISHEDARKIFKSALEKIELALVWANPGAKQLAGSRRRFPTDGEPVALQFESFGASNATLFEAVTYRPSLTNGLRFLETRSFGTYGCLPYGDALADAFEESVASLPEADWLRSVEALHGRHTQIEALAAALDVTAPADSEQTAFLASFFPEKPDANATNDERARRMTLQLMLRSIQATCQATRASASIGEIRACMARAVAGDGTIVSPGVERVQAWWAVLQLRQLQRLCLEKLYGVVEHWVGVHETGPEKRTIDTCTVELARTACAGLNEALRDSVGQMVDFFASIQDDHVSLYLAAAHWTDDGSDNDADVFFYIRELQRSTFSPGPDGEIAAVAYAFIGLVFCAVEAGNLMADPECMNALKADNDSCSLQRLAEFVNRCRDGSVEDFLSSVIKDWVILRHFTVVASRSAAMDGKNRFRIVIGDQGLERFVKSAKYFHPDIAQDKLHHALLLCQQCGLIRAEDGGFVLTPLGKARAYD